MRYFSINLIIFLLPHFQHNYLLRREPWSNWSTVQLRQHAIHCICLLQMETAAFDDRLWFLRHSYEVLSKQTFLPHISRSESSNM